MTTTKRARKGVQTMKKLYCDESAEGGKTSRTGEKIVDKHRSVTAPTKHRIMS